MRAVFDTYIGGREKVIVTDKLLFGPAAASAPLREDVLTATVNELPRVTKGQDPADKHLVARIDTTASSHVPERSNRAACAGSAGTADGDRRPPTTSNVMQKMPAKTLPDVHANGSLSTPPAATTEHRDTVASAQYRHLASPLSPDAREPQVQAGELSNTEEDTQPQAKRSSAAMAATNPTADMASKRAKTDAALDEGQVSPTTEGISAIPSPVDASQLSQGMDAEEPPGQIEYPRHHVPSANGGPSAPDFIAVGHATAAQVDGDSSTSPLVGEGPLLPGQEREESEAGDAPKSMFLRDLDGDGAEQVVSTALAKLLSALSPDDVPADVPEGHCRTCGEEATAGGLPVCQPCWTAMSVVLSQNHGVDSHASFWRETIPPFPLPAGITLPRSSLRIFATEVGLKYGLSHFRFGSGSNSIAGTSDSPDAPLFFLP